MSRAFKVIILTTFILLSPSPYALAQSAPAASVPADCQKLKNDFEQFGGGNIVGTFPKYCSVGSASKKVINTIFLFTGSAAVLSVMVNGVRYVIAGTSADAVKKAKAGITWSFIGLFAVLAAYFLVAAATNLIVNGKVI